MRELERTDSDDPRCPPAEDVAAARVTVVGRGRLGLALSAALVEAGLQVDGPIGRGAEGNGADVVLLCVPDGEIAAAADAIRPGPLVGHCSGATGLEVLDEHEAFSLHPLMTVRETGARFEGAGAAIDGATARARATAEALACAVGMRPVRVPPELRGAYHAAASVASNYLITLQAAAERLAATAGLDRAQLAPLVEATIENWRHHGAGALTGPVARGDHETVAVQRAAVREHAPELLDLFDALTLATRELAGIGATAETTGTRGTRGTPGTTATGGTDEADAARRGPGGAPMTIVRTVAELRATLAPERGAGRRIGLVPTMGAFHGGHLSLMRRARELADVVVVSLFVNPTQFRPGEDLSAYPRDEAGDARLAAAEGVDVLFAPAVEEIYPAGFSTTVEVAGITEPLCGTGRGPGHFHGVATVVTKLLNMVQPDVAVFGQKDAQQALVIRRVVRDLSMPVTIDVAPTVREPDGLAMSSRNAYLDDAARVRARALSQGLRAARDAAAGGERDAVALVAAARVPLAAAGIEPEYVELVGSDDLRPIARLNGEALLAVAAQVGAARLIDNALFTTR